VKRTSILFVILLLSAFILALTCIACPSSSRPVAGKKSIVVTYSILGSLVKDLIGDKAVITVSIPDGLDPHEWEPSARDIEAINKADLVVENGLSLEGGLQKTLQEAKDRGIKFFTASDHIIIRHVAPGEGIPSNDPDQQVGAPDPHIWMDPLAMKSVVDALSTELKQDFNLDVSLDSTNLQDRLDKLDQEVATILSPIPVENRKLVTGHESMGYFAQRYGFKLVGVIIPSLSSQAEVSAADLAALKQIIQENQVKAIFTELGTTPAVAKAIGDETGVKVIELRAAVLPSDDSYFTFMKDIATVVMNALQ
jgi:zinc/manganese transport system substrate-binding protein